MDFRWPEEFLAFRDEVEAFIHEWRTPELAIDGATDVNVRLPYGMRQYSIVSTRMNWYIGSRPSPPISFGQHMLIQPLSCSALK